jgi:serine/threonine protein phosphatase PrpC
MDEPTQRFRYVVSSGTDVGRVRSLNEDALIDRGDIGLWAVADGMGGHDAGDFASQAVVDALGQVAPPSDALSFLRDVEERIQGAHAVLRRESLARESGGIIGSTMVALLTWNRHYACVWAGDSRLYLLRNGVLRQISRDHSIVQDLVDAGELAPEQAESHPQANVVTRAVGAVEDLVLDKVHEQISIGDMFLLCSDGLTRHVSDQEIAAVLTGEKAPGVAQVLIDLALERGAKDNVTAVVVRCELADGASGDPGGGPQAEPLPEAWDENPETTMPMRARFPLADGPTAEAAIDEGPAYFPGKDQDLGLDPPNRPVDPDSGSGSGAAPEDPLASILADGPADRVTDAGAADMADDLDPGRDPLDLAEDSDPLLAAGPSHGPSAACASAAFSGKAPANRLAGPRSGRGIRIGLLMCVVLVALAAAAYVLYNILTLP